MKEDTLKLKIEDLAKEVSKKKTENHTTLEQKDESWRNLG